MTLFFCFYLGEIVVVDLTADDDDEEVDDGASTVEFEPDVESASELDGRFTVDFELYAEPIPGLELLVVSKFVVTTYFIHEPIPCGCI